MGYLCLELLQRNLVCCGHILILGLIPLVRDQAVVHEDKGQSYKDDHYMLPES